MTEKKMHNLLGALAGKTCETARPQLADEIKHNIPENLHLPKKRMDTINVIIDLKINKLAAAAIIIITMLLLANVLDKTNTNSQGLYAESKLLLRYWLGGEQPAEKTKLAIASQFYEKLARQKGKDFKYYDVDVEDSNTVLMHWKQQEGNYKIVFSDLSTRVVNAEELVELLADMLQKQTKGEK